ncbi:MAG: restriction endonuclease subunit S [Bacteroidia bacterium]|nr:restriction endonuclease subunit S [Bacteroidia bacterium]
MSWKEIKFADFLKERKGLLEPNNTNLFNFKKIDKIDFSKGNLFLTEYSPTKTKQIIVYPNDFIFSGLNIEKGAVTINTTGEQLVVSANYSTCEVDYSVIDMDFFLLFMKSLSFKNLLKENLKKDYGFTRPKHLEQIKFFIPSSLEEQRKLVKLANKNKKIVDEISTEISHQINFAKKLRQQLLQDAVQGKLVMQNENVEPASELLKKIKDEKKKMIAEKKLKKEKELPPIKPEEIPFEIPENWVWCRLGEVVSHIFDGPFGSHLKSSDYKTSGVQVIRLQNLGFMKFKEEKEAFVSIEKYNTIKQHTVYEGDIIIGSFLADGVNCVILPKLNYTAIAKADCFTIRISHLNVIKRFVMFLLSSEPMFNELSKLLRGMTRLRINTTQLKNLPIPLPPLSEQNHIVQKLDELMQSCNELEASIKQSESQNKKLLQQVLREALRKEPVGV